MPPTVQYSCVAGSGGEGKAVFLRGAAQLVVDEAGFHPGVALFWIEFQQAIEVLRKVDDDGGVARLAGEAGARASSEDGDAVLAADCYCGDHVLDRLRDDHADGNLTIVTEVGGVKCAGSVVETHLRFGAPLQALGQLFGKRSGDDRQSRRHANS